MIEGGTEDVGVSELGKLMCCTAPKGQLKSAGPEEGGPSPTD